MFNCCGCMVCQVLKCPRFVAGVRRIAANSGGGSNITIQTITETAYLALSDSQKANPDILWVIIPD